MFPLPFVVFFVCVDAQDVYLLPIVVDSGNQPEAVAMDVEHRASSADGYRSLNSRIARRLITRTVGAQGKVLILRTICQVLFHFDGCPAVLPLLALWRRWSTTFPADGSRPVPFRSAPWSWADPFAGACRCRSSLRKDQPTQDSAIAMKGRMQPNSCSPAGLGSCGSSHELVAKLR